MWGMYMQVEFWSRIGDNPIKILLEPGQLRQFEEFSCSSGGWETTRTLYWYEPAGNIYKQWVRTSYADIICTERGLSVAPSCRCTLEPTDDKPSQTHDYWLDHWYPRFDICGDVQ